MRHGAVEIGRDEVLLLETPDYYQLLGVSRYASEAIIKRAYRAKILALHPDRNPKDSTAVERTRQIIEAYKVLSDPVRRRLYDATLLPAHTVYADHILVCSVQPRFVLPAYVLKTAGYIVTLALILCIVLTAVQAIFSDSGLVFRPNTAYLQTVSEPRSYPLLIYPDMYDSLAWYNANEYQLSLASEWMAQRMREAYLEAAFRADLQGDKNRAAFFKFFANRIAPAKKPHFDLSCDFCQISPL